MGGTDIGTRQGGGRTGIRTLKRRTPLKAKKGLARGSKPCPTVDAMLKSGMVSRGSGFKAKPKPIPKRSKKNKGWWDVALEIWDERKRVCEVTGSPLGDVPNPSFFSHLLPRGSYRKYKRDKRNIRLQSPEIHALWHKHGPEILKAYPEWRKTTEMYFKLRDEANGLSRMNGVDASGDAEPSDT